MSFESKFGTNHLGHFALTNLLLEHITGRIVTVASQAERLARLDFDDLNWEHRPYQPSRAYNDSKLANLLFTAELQRRLSATRSDVLATAAHPGLVATNIYHHPGPRRPADLLWAVAIRLLAQGADHGALPVLYAAAAADIPGNSFAGPSHFAHMRGAPELIDRSAAAQDPDLARRLWTVSEQLTGVRFPI
ncbi:short-chain dehydrogenase [Actinopolymorpha pittospori]|uniref:NAD(P)-dependent dehydrogenase (Short-subunit alcohol dehydrogenase family) n=1 Tax=Actinopolymorpha pittospori TaxID=648752 RepID=A0A927MRI6_9ACTN|nr:short-chain dehydrogenase [Actinopolymorpha pittospori]MBE1603568.1 NAD(P)-dependent dehydrogenase (short-subunit alcohol dehydrogenase family) [Actinopolymorpha pittospori]